ncbi:interleukin 17 receptor A1a [Syngnathoides biaculeatus]|uniref:interleukin 17 receptor A1a n=1 Tax=Syngnathoides biaculeatus TaxID=300417 RepID=UPI002ADE24D1|nr:interleukin 17 receptor A1a [Syngnathoides biaculeatus]
MRLYGGFLAFMCVSLSSALTTLTSASLNCSQQGLRCSVSFSNCLIDSEMLKVREYTPSGPLGLSVSVTTVQDEAGALQPVLVANWTIRDDGSISFLKATELHVMKMATNENLCVRYAFKNKLPMRNLHDDKWSFSANMVVLDPEHGYWVSVFNIPKPEVGHSDYDVSENVVVPGCQDTEMSITQYCIERGSLWKSNISLVPSAKLGEALSVSFSPDPLCDEYVVIVNCASTQHVDRAYRVNRTRLNVTFSLNKWPRFCCQFDVSIKPMFQKCGQDCTRHKKTLHICPAKPTDPPEAPQYTPVIVCMVLLCAGIFAVFMYILCRKPGNTGGALAAAGDEKPKQHQQQIQQTPKVLVIYSQDHRLYRDVVLKLCAFLRAKCGAEVLIDLLDTTSLGMIGRLCWLEWQRQQLKNPTDKVLVLCSRGVQAKWRAMCGQRRVILKEDLLSPTDDMLTPFLNLFLPDLHQARKHGKYMVAYFSDISSERDVPSVFDIAVKYTLMKHFEELYFGLLDIEKYQPGLVNHIEGIGRDEYFNCPSGKALKNAIETFQAYQIENPDWFENECIHSEEDLLMEADPLIDQWQASPVLECLPLIRNGLPVYSCEAEIRENGSRVQVLNPELNPNIQHLSVAELLPLMDPAYNHQQQSVPPHPCPQKSAQSVLLANPVLSGQHCPPAERRQIGQVPEENEDAWPSGSTVLKSKESNSRELARPSMENPPQNQTRHPVAVPDNEASEEGSNSASDLGYISKMPSPLVAPDKEDPLVALARLQEELFLQTLDSSEFKL